MSRPFQPLTASSPWATRRARWGASRIDGLRTIARFLAGERHQRNKNLVEPLRAAFIAIYHQEFLETRYACEAKPVYRYKKAAKAAGVGHVYRCRHCRSWHPGNLPSVRRAT